MRFSIWNPLRFVTTLENYIPVVDWEDVFPNGDNQLNSATRHRGAYAAKSNLVFKRDSIRGQFQSSTLFADPNSDISFTAISLDGDALNILYNIINITPSSWAAGGSYERYIYEYEIILISSHKSFLQLRIFDGSNYCISEPFKVLDYLKDFVELEYTNSRNDYGMLFLGDDDIQYSYKIYVEAVSFPNPSTKKSVYNNDGNEITTRANPVRGLNLIITYIPGFLLEKLDFIFNCDSITINSVSVNAEDGFDKSQLDGVYNGFSGKITLTQNKWDYRDNNTIIPQVLLIDSDNEVLGDEDDEVISN